MLTFEKITKDNIEDAFNIKVTEEQDKIIAPVEISLAEAYVAEGVLLPFLICDDMKPVGFILFCIEKDENLYEVCRLMIDKNNQGKGYGKKAMELAIEFLKNKGADKICLSHRTDNPAPSHLYQSLGFKYTGVIDEEERLMELIL